MHKEKKRIHISLAHFDEQGNAEEEKTDKGNKATYQKLINMLEGKIFNQLLHQVDPSRIPKARFQRKEDMSLRKGIYRQRKTRGRFFCPGSQEQRGRNAICVPLSPFIVEYWFWLKLRSHGTRWKILTWRKCSCLPHKQEAIFYIWINCKVEKLPYLCLFLML